MAFGIGSVLSGVGALGGLFGGGGKSASSAAAAQAAQMEKALEQQKKVYDTARTDFAPYMGIGSAATYRLADLLGLSIGQPGAENRQQIYDRLKGNYTTKTTTGPAEGSPLMYVDRNGKVVRFNSEGEFNQYASMQGGQQEFTPLQAPGQTSESVDTAALNAAVDAELAKGGKASDFGYLTKKFGMEDYEADPGYAFRKAEGEKALSRAQAARGNFLSGAAIKDAQRFGQDIASDEFGKSYGRFMDYQNNLFSRLAGVSGAGQSAVGSLGSIGSQTAANMQNAYAGIGDAQASGIVGAANARNQTLGNLFSGLSQYGQQLTKRGY